MKFATFAVAVLLVAVAAYAAGPPLTAVPPYKDAEVYDPPAWDGRIEGDTIEECWGIPGLPFSASGTTVGYADNYDEVCDYTGSFSPDVVYCYYAEQDVCVSISLCNSFYDTKVYVYEDAWTPGTYYCCNDDNFDCLNPPVSFTSWIPECFFAAGHEYYIVVDGYGSASGNYVLEIEEVECTPPCIVECPPTAIDEGEGECYDEYNDLYNAGCNSVPESYTYVGHRLVLDGPDVRVDDRDALPRGRVRLHPRLR